MSCIQGSGSWMNHWLLPGSGMRNWDRHMFRFSLKDVCEMLSNDLITFLSKSGRFLETWERSFINSELSWCCLCWDFVGLLVNRESEANWPETNWNRSKKTNFAGFENSISLLPIDSVQRATFSFILFRTIRSRCCCCCWQMQHSIAIIRRARVWTIVRWFAWTRNKIRIHGH